VPIALDILLPPEPVSGRDARARIEPLAGSVGADVLDDVSLLVSELVTNSVRHARFQEGESIEVSVKVNDVLRVEVRDPGPGFDRRTFDDAAPLRAAGWGLLLVDRLTDRWGVDRTGGTKVWFEIGLGSGLPGRPPG
jgi:anti-sigma regulatory factor (Ser/Thr protein kinase)